jgi:signal transduction histidine kinase
MNPVVEGDEPDSIGSLLDAVLLISSDLDLRGALDRLVRAASSMTDARYGVLALVDDSGSMADFIIHGIDEETIARIPSLPTGHGILGMLLEDSARPIRIDDISAHPKAMGFPAHHPQMETFLGVPVRVDGQIYGNLYLAEKADGALFTEDDEQLLDEFSQIASLVIANARTHASAERRHRWLEASIVMSHELESSVDPGEALAAVVEHLRVVADAVAVGAVRDDENGLELVAAADADGSAADEQRLTERWGKAIAAASIDGRAVLANLDEGAVDPGGARVVIPMSSRLLRGHFLLVSLDPTVLRIGDPDLDLFTAFADQASLVLDRTQALAEREEHRLVSDRNRIARDLHDSVIQRLFATGLQLQGIRRTVDDDAVKASLDESVGELNTTIRDIRSTIFELRQDRGTSLMAEIRALAEQYIPVLGFTPFVRLRGPIDAAVMPSTAEQLIATLREALSNVARHADADACIVEVEVLQDQLVLRVSDNGCGISAEVAESGLHNIRRRAFDQGGTFKIGPEEPHGTLIEWQVPTVL